MHDRSPLGQSTDSDPSTVNVPPPAQDLVTELLPPKESWLDDAIASWLCKAAASSVATDCASPVTILPNSYAQQKRAIADAGIRNPGAAETALAAAWRAGGVRN